MSIYSRKRTRVDPLPARLVVGINDFYYAGKWYYPTETYTTFSWSYRSEDTCLDSTHPGPPYRSGGALSVFHYNNPKDDIRGVGTYVSGTSGIIYRYRGGFLPSASLQDAISGINQNIVSQEAATPGSQFPSYVSTTAQGATGWARYRPGKPVADVGVFVGEFKELPRMLQTTAKGFHSLWREMGGSKTQFGPKSVANHWLNTQFGWLPFLNDLRKFVKASENCDAHFKQLRRDNGRWVRRGGSVGTTFSSEVVRENATVTAHWPVLGTGFYVSPSSSGSHKVTREVTDHSWFRGAFRYWIPNVESIQWKARALANLYGAMPSPSLVWELTPWSWLVDWHSNMGDVISNLSLSATDNLAAKYAYVMRTREVSADVNSYHALKSAVLHDNWRFSLCWKNRSEANPFGFGLTDADLSARQWSILAALGITRLH